MLPSRSWDAYEAELRELGERRFVGSAADLSFLEELGLVSSGGRLSVSGQDYFSARHIRGDNARADEILHDAVLKLPTAAAVVQLLAGLGPVPRARAEVVLRSQGFGDLVTERSVGQLLSLLNRVRAIRYAKGQGALEVIENPASADSPPRSIFVAPETPYANRVWLRRILEECDGFIYWLDKHFMANALEVLWEAADRAKVSDIRILSLALPDNSGKAARRAYRDLQRDLVARGITLEWRTIDSTVLKRTHDRWIIGSGSARNVPNVDAIMSGQHSELNLSDQHEQLRALFESYWQQGLPMASVAHARSA